jgi:hypothetical protein
MPNNIGNLTAPGDRSSNINENSFWVANLYNNLYFLEPDWSCTCSVTLKLLAQKEGKADYACTMEHVFKANQSVVKEVGEMPLDVSECIFLQY